MKLKELVKKKLNTTNIIGKWKMKGVNKVILVGRLGQDPESRFFPDGSCVANCTLATSEKWKDKQTGEDKERTDWHRLTFNGRIAEIAAEYLTKGSLIYIEGKLITRKWQNQQGQDQYTTEINVRDMQMLGSNNQGQQAKPQQQAPAQQKPQQQGYQPPQQPPGGWNMAQNGGQAPNPQNLNAEFDEDLPF